MLGNRRLSFAGGCTLLLLACASPSMVEDGFFANCARSQESARLVLFVCPKEQLLEETDTIWITVGLANVSGHRVVVNDGFYVNGNIVLSLTNPSGGRVLMSDEHLAIGGATPTTRRVLYPEELIARRVNLACITPGDRPAPSGWCPYSFRIDEAGSYTVRVRYDNGRQILTTEDRSEAYVKDSVEVTFRLR